MVVMAVGRYLGWSNMEPVFLASLVSGVALMASNAWALLVLSRNFRRHFIALLGRQTSSTTVHSLQLNRS